MKIFGTRDFGYHRITVERPLKLRFEITEDTLAALEASKPLAKWDGRDAFICCACAACSARCGGRRRRPSAALLAAARSGGALWPSHGVVPEGDLVGGLGLRPRRRGPAGQGRQPRAGPGPARLRERAPGRGHRRLLRPRGHAARPRRLDRLHARRRSATRSPSPATSTSTPPRAPSPRSTPNSATWNPRSRNSSAR